MDRADNLCMMRIRNEARWLRRSLERTWQVCQTVVIFDDHSTDASRDEAIRAMQGDDWAKAVIHDHSTWFTVTCLSNGQARDLHWLRSPFQDTTDEVRDKNHLWEYVGSQKFRHVLCLDGDEMLSQAAIRHFATATAKLEHGGADVIAMPFMYLWDQEDRRRIDGVYSDIRHARMFTVDRAPKFREYRFAARGPAGFHCGSIPDMLSTNHFHMTEMPIIHFGYVDDEIRHRKLDFYTHLDPNNEGEGYYRHIVGEANKLAPGPVRLIEYDDK